MRKSKTKIVTLLILLLIVLCFAGWRLSLADVYWQKTDIIYAAWRQPDQVGSNWSNTIFVSRYAPLLRTLSGSLLSLKMAGANFSNANLSNVGINDTFFKDTKLISANMKHSYFRRCTFKGCDLRNADLRNAHLNRTVFWNVDLRGANLGEADLSGAGFYNVDLRGANLKGIKLGLTAYDSHTKWPHGYHLNEDVLIPMEGPPVFSGR